MASGKQSCVVASTREASANCNQRDTFTDFLPFHLPCFFCCFFLTRGLISLNISFLLNISKVNLCAWASPKKAVWFWKLEEMFRRKIKNRPLPTEEEKTGDVVDDLAPAADTLKYTLQAWDPYESFVVKQQLLGSQKAATCCQTPSPWTLNVNKRTL